MVTARFVEGEGGNFDVVNYNGIKGVRMEQTHNKDDSIRANVVFDRGMRHRASYEHPDYPFRDTEPSERAGYLYMGLGFNELDIHPLPNRGRLLIAQEPLPCDEIQLVRNDTPWGVKSMARLLEPGDYVGVADTIYVITSKLIGLDEANAAEASFQIQRKLREGQGS